MLIMTLGFEDVKKNKKKNKTSKNIIKYMSHMYMILIIERKFIRLVYSIRSQVVPLWPSADWRAREISSCSVKEAGAFKENWLMMHPFSGLKACTFPRKLMVTDWFWIVNDLEPGYHSSKSALAEEMWRCVCIDFLTSSTLFPSRLQPIGLCYPHSRRVFRSACCPTE